MVSLFRIVFKWIFAIGLMATAASAQETTAPQNETQVGQIYVKSVEGDWVHRCVKTESGKDPCHIFQRVIFNNEAVIAEASIVPITDGGPAVAGITFKTPLETALQAPLRFQIDDRDPKLYPYAYCTVEGCIANVGLTAVELNAMKKGERGQVTIVSIRDAQNPVIVPVSLKGFTAAYNLLLQ